MDAKGRSTVSVLLLIIITSLATSNVRCATQKLRSRRLVGGRAADTRYWGFIAKIKYKPRANVMWKVCSASLIDSQWLLTAAHCLQDVNGKVIRPEDFVIALGDEHDYSKINDYVVSNLTVPYNESGRNDTPYTLFDDDIALIKLRDKVSPNIQRISFSTKWTKAQLGSCKVAGWGSNSKMSVADTRSGNYTLPDSLQEIAVSFLPFKKYCRNLNEYGKFCMGSIGPKGNFLNGACIGDSGSPLICENETGKYLTGIVVGGSGSCKPLSLIVTNLSAYAKWIRRKRLILSMY